MVNYKRVLEREWCIPKRNQGPRLHVAVVPNSGSNYMSCKFSADVFHIDVPILYAFTNEMVANIDVLASSMKNWIICETIEEKLSSISKEKAEVETLLRDANKEFPNDDNMKQLFEQYKGFFKEIILLEEAKAQKAPQNVKPKPVAVNTKETAEKPKSAENVKELAEKPKEPAEKALKAPQNVKPKPAAVKTKEAAEKPKPTAENVKELAENVKELAENVKELAEKPKEPKYMNGKYMNVKELAENVKESKFCVCYNI
nr:cytochrome P450 [Tanacetum cinerariifolium]